MKRFTLVLFSAALLTAQDATSWRSGLSSLPATPPPGTMPQDVAQFEQNMRMAAVSIGAAPHVGPEQWEANRALVRRMAAYLYGLQALSAGDRQLRGSFYRAQHSFASLGLANYLAYGAFAYPAPQSDGAPPPPPSPNRPLPPPFAMSAPDSSTPVSDADKDTAADLRSRYETDAAHSAGIWQNGETLRQSLEASGLGLNTQTATSMARLPQLFNAAASALSRNDWEDARTRLMQAEAETEKIAKTVGR